jgi:hypothetical protein
MILPFFPTYLCYCELLWQHFPPVLFKLQLYPIGIEYRYQVLHVPPQEEVARKFCGLEEHSRTLHHTLHMYSLFENKRAIFTKF